MDNKYQKRDRSSSWLSSAKINTLGSIFSILSFLLTLGSFIYGSEVQRQLLQSIGPKIMKPLVASLVIGGGIGAHWFKRKSLRWYGTIEVIFGVTAAISITMRLTTGQAMFAQWTSLVACAYVIARGLNNISDSRKPQPREAASVAAT